MKLSIHDLSRRSTVSVSCETASISSFNSRPLKEVDAVFASLYNFSILSIHDLSRRSTENISGIYKITNLSIHDLSRRSTGVAVVSFQSEYTFNSRPLKEVDETNS